MYILGISAFYHDSAACLLKDGQVVFAIQEERLSRKKHDDSFPTLAIIYILENTKISLHNIDAIVFYDKPLLKIERIIESFFSTAPRGLRSFVYAMPKWMNEKLFLKRLIRRSLKEIDSTIKSPKIYFPEHHLSHAASSYFCSPYSDSAIVTIDGVGEWSTLTICHGKDNTIKLHKQLNYPHSLGLLYSAFTYFLGFKVNSGEYKLMGLAPYGDPKSTFTKNCISKIKEFLVDIKDDGSIFLDQKYFNYATGLKMIQTSKWEELFEIEQKEPESEFLQKHSDLALAIQTVTEEIVLKVVKHAKDITGSDNLCLAGGVALNCVANGKILESQLFSNIFIQPAAGDAGGSLGAALTYHHLSNDSSISSSDRFHQSHSYFGPEYNDEAIANMISINEANAEHIPDFKLLSEKSAQLLADGKVIGWFQGAMEFGPRALGNRSILGDPRNPEMKKIINLKIKFRESFRPFAPSVLKEDASKWFEFATDSDYMLLVDKIKKEHRIDGQESKSLREKTYSALSVLPSITHYDHSCRVQTVDKKTNFRYWSLINDFKKITDVGIVINTSFNVRGEPIVCSPQDAYQCFMATNMDYLVIGNYLLDKQKQTQNNQFTNYIDNLVLD